MSPKYRTVATFSLLMEADMARNRLEAEGIPALVADAESTSWWGAGNNIPSIKLQVPEEHVERACAILGPIFERQEERNRPEDLPPEDGIQTELTCGQCGTRVEPDLVSCPRCGTSLDVSQAVTTVPVRTALTADRPLPREEDEEEEEPWEEDLGMAVGDALAARALKAALIGLVFFPVFVYSAWLLLQLFQFGGEVSPAGRRNAMTALVVDLAALAVGLFFFVSVG
jgi:hypothetical protein